jgi:DNA polymerase V
MITDVQTMLDQRKQLFASFNTISFPTDSPKQYSIPLFTGKVAAGFPSPADDYIEKTLDLNDLLIQKPQQPFLFVHQVNLCWVQAFILMIF